MGILDKFLDRDKTSQITVTNPKEVFSNILKKSSGIESVKVNKFDIFYQIIAFKGVTGGCGTSTLVANTALALAKAGLTVCVFDTSILAPVQDELLKTKVLNKEPEDVCDWFDLPFTKKTVLNESTRTSGVSVLSFKGKNRGIVDMLSTNDSDTLVDMAITQFHNKFDIILIDCCQEMTSINAACIQMAQKVIQVWSDSPTTVPNIDNFVTNNVTLSCPLDKMRNVIFSKMSRGIMGSNLNNLLSQYRFNLITTTYLAEEVNNQMVLKSGCIFQVETTNQDVIDYTNSIIEIFCHICNIDLTGEKEKRKAKLVSSQDIMDGKVEGTVTKKLMDRAKSQGYGSAIQVQSTDELDLFLEEGGKK